MSYVYQVTASSSVTVVRMMLSKEILNAYLPLVSQSSYSADLIQPDLMHKCCHYNVMHIHLMDNLLTQYVGHYARMNSRFLLVGRDPEFLL